MSLKLCLFVDKLKVGGISRGALFFIEIQDRTKA